MVKQPAIGIDLGTTYSVVAVCKNDAVDIVANDQGNRTTPSCVAFTETERLVGEGALYQAPNNPENTIYAAKRLIGRDYDENDVQKDIRNWPFKVIEDNNQIKIVVEFKREEKTYFPEEISSMVLAKMKQTVEDYVGTEIKDVVVTVPAYFTNSQRQATKDAAQIAGLHVIRMINEPTAAAMAYGHTTNNKGRKNVLIYDFGGGTFDVSILLMKDKDYRVRAISGDPHLGGEDFDTILVKHFVEEFKRKFGQDISADKSLLRSLRTHCERAKRILSSADEARFNLEGTTLVGTITRARFEDLCNDLFEKSIVLVDKAIKDAELNKIDIHDVVLVGGSSRIPKIQELLTEYFDGKQLNKSINPDECVAYGAAIQAAMLNEDGSSQMKGLTLCDACPLSLGVELVDGSMAVVIERNSSIPIRKVRTFQTAKDNTDEVDVKIYEGERYMCEDNNFLGEFSLKDIPIAPRGGGKIDITFAIDINGMLNVTAREQLSGNTSTISIINKSRLSREDTNRMVREAIDFRDQDQAQRKRVEAMNELESYCFKIKRTAKSLADRHEILGDDQTKITQKCDHTLTWLDANRDESKTEYDNKRFEIEEMWTSITEGNDQQVE